MAWMNALTLLDWDILVFWCMVVASLLFLLVLLATIFLQEDQTSKSSRANSCQTVLQQLLSQKLLPIESSLGWQLAGVFNNLRVWTRQCTLSDRQSWTLHGCCAIVDEEAEDVLAAVQNITKQQEWDPFIASITQSSPPRVIDALDDENPVMMDVVHIKPSSHGHQEPIKRGILRLALDWCLWKLLGFMKFGRNHSNEAVNRKNIVINRIWKVERDGSCWMFCRNEQDRAATHTAWCYFLIKPALETSGRSIIHFILSPSLESGKMPEVVGKRLAVRLAALRQYITHTHLKLHPLTHSTLQHISDLLPVFTEEDDEPVSMQDTTAEKPSGSQAYHGKKGGDDRRADTAEAKNIQTVTSSTTKPKPPRKSPSSSGKPKKAMPSRSRRSRARALGVGGGAGGGSFGDGDGGDTDSSSSEDTGYSDWMSNKGSLERDGKAPGAVTSDPGIVTSMIDYMACDEEPTSLKDGSSELYTLASQCTAELLGQSIQVTTINVNSTVAQQKAQTGGWFFHSVAKDVVILQKNPVQGKYHCFLGKGLIRAPPEEVFKAVKNPRTRFIYDNMLKKMDIIKELDDKVQIVHAVHEVPQLLRKESRDFCMLQASKIEGSVYVVSFTSVNVTECPPSEAITRSHVLPSGWVIEPVRDNRGLCSMVTYLVQVSVGGKGVPASFIYFLSRRVPLSVAYLRMFIEAESL